MICTGPSQLRVHAMTTDRRSSSETVLLYGTLVVNGTDVSTLLVTLDFTDLHTRTCALSFPPPLFSRDLVLLSGCELTSCSVCAHAKNEPPVRVRRCARRYGQRL